MRPALFNHAVRAMAASTGQFARVQGWLRARLAENGEVTLDGLVVELAEAHGISVHRDSVWRVLRKLGLAHKKDLQALEQKRKDAFSKKL